MWHLRVYDDDEEWIANTRQFPFTFIDVNMTDHDEWESKRKAEKIDENAYKLGVIYEKNLSFLEDSRPTNNHLISARLSEGWIDRDLLLFITIESIQIYILSRRVIVRFLFCL